MTEFGLHFTDTGQAGLQIIRQGTSEFKVGNTNQSLNAYERVFGQNPILRLNDGQANRGLIDGMSQLLINDGATETTVHVNDYTRHRELQDRTGQLLNGARVHCCRSK